MLHIVFHGNQFSHSRISVTLETVKMYLEQNQLLFIKSTMLIMKMIMKISY